MSTNLNKREILRKKKEEKKRRNILTFISIIAGVVIIFVLASVLPKLALKQTKYEGNQGFTVGSPDAPVTVVQFSSYYCSFCKTFSDHTEKDFIAEYVDTGKVYYRYVNVPSGDEVSQRVSEASYCAADQNRFFEYKDLLYTYAGSAEGFSQENLVNYANTIGMDQDAFQACLDADTFADAYLDDINFADSVGLKGTPSFLVNDQLVFSSELNATVDALLGQ